MKLLNRNKFLEIKNAVVFSYFSNNVFMEFKNLYIKYPGYGNDFVVQDLLNEIGFLYEGKVGSGGIDNMYEAERILEEGGSIELDLECCGRDGMFDEKQRFIVYEDKDIKKLINKLQEVLLSNQSKQDDN